MKGKNGCVKTDKRAERNRGSAAIEAAIAIPIFLFFMLFIYETAESIAAESIVYEACVETSEYMAEYAYLLSSIAGDSDRDEYGMADTGGISAGEVAGQAAAYAIARQKLEEYTDDSELVERYVKGGISGVSILGSELPDADGYIIFNVRYTVTLHSPLGTFERECEEKIRQKAYLGCDSTLYGAADADDRYVYVTDNRDVYHTSRHCTHLRLSIRSSDYNTAVSMGLEPCEYCGGVYTGEFYVTDEGDKYHTALSCQGLRRTVYRIKLSETGGIPKCQRCR